MGDLRKALFRCFPAPRRVPWRVDEKGTEAAAATAVQRDPGADLRDEEAAAGSGAEPVAARYLRVVVVGRDPIHDLSVLFATAEITAGIKPWQPGAYRYQPLPRFVP